MQDETPVLCELCKKSYTIGVMKKHKQVKSYTIGVMKKHKHLFREKERERELLGTIHNGGSRAAPAHGLRITTLRSV